MLRPVIYAAVAGLFAFAGSASAQNYPNRPITMIIPFAAGGPTDVLGRIVGARMSELLGQQVVIENVGGAGGMTGSKRVDGCQARRLHDRHRHGRHPRPGPDALQAPALQFADRLPAGRTAGPGADPAHSAQGPAGQGPQGVPRLRQGEPGQDAVRLGRRGLRHAPRLRAAELSDGHQHRARAVQRHRPGDGRAAGRPHRLHVRDHRRPRSRTSTPARSAR